MLLVSAIEAIFSVKMKKQNFYLEKKIFKRRRVVKNLQLVDRLYPGIKLHALQNELIKNSMVMVIILLGQKSALQDKHQSNEPFR